MLITGVLFPCNVSINLNKLILGHQCPLQRIDKIAQMWTCVLMGQKMGPTQYTKLKCGHVNLFMWAKRKETRIAQQKGPKMSL